MTHPKQTPSQTALEHGMPETNEQWDALAATVLAVRESEECFGDKVLREGREQGLCSCDQEWSDPECTATTHAHIETPAAPTLDERIRLRRLVLETANAAGVEASLKFVDLLLSERAAVRAECRAEIERLEAELDELGAERNQHQDAAHKLRVENDRLISERAAVFAQGDAQGYERGRAEGEADTKGLLTPAGLQQFKLMLLREPDYRELQSKYETLDAAAREARANLHRRRDIPGYGDCVRALDAVLDHDLTPSMKS